MKKLSDFKVGDRVRMTDGVLHKRYAGMEGTVEKTIKSRNLVKVGFENGDSYEAFPENVEKIEESEESEYDVRIEERLVKTVKVKAKSPADAEQLVSDEWHNSHYILDAECFSDVQFHAERRAS